MRIPAQICEDHFRVVEPQINAEGVHVWPFDAAFPVDVRFMTGGLRQNVRMNRHDYFELMYLCAGAAHLDIQDRSLPFHQGELSVIGSTLYHRLEARRWPFTVAVLFFQPDLIRADRGAESAEYLTPFLLQDSQFPHIIGSDTGIPGEVFRLMQRIREELPATTTLAKLAVKTYLKMILLLLVKQYSSYAGTVETFQRQQRALERLRPVFNHLEQQYGEPIHIQQAARICGMSQSHFMSFFKHATGQSFMAYLNHYRIERAQELLVSTDQHMAEIGQETGFCDQSYFGTVFRRIVGMTPAAYRKRYRGQVNLPSVIQHAGNGRPALCSFAPRVLGAANGR